MSYPARATAPIRGASAAVAARIRRGTLIDVPSCLRRLPHHGGLVLAGSHVGAGKDLVAGDPLEGLLVGLLGVGLEHQPLARAPASRVHLGVPAGRELLRVVMRVAVRAQVDVALRALEGAE